MKKRTPSLWRALLPYRFELPSLDLLSRAAARLVACAALLAGAGVEAADDYRIAPLDMLQFQIYEEPDTQISQRVSASGEMPLPLVGVVKVVGMTLREAENQLRDLYVEKGFFVDPQVILVLQQYNERSVSVLGQVNRPEQIAFPLEAQSMSVVHAITLAGGLTRIARADAVQVTRLEGRGERRFTVNVEAYFADSRKASAPPSPDAFRLLPGDIIFVPERGF